MVSNPAVSVAISEKEVLKMVLEFLENRRLHITQLSLERETGLINGEYSDDVLFLRQLILDGQWDAVLEFADPLKALPGFEARFFRFQITKYKYFELLCIKQEPGPLQDNDFAVEEIVECLRELEQVCESVDEFRQLCALLTLPKLSDHELFHGWNPSSARMECFHAVLPIVSNHIDSLNPTANREKMREDHSVGDRLIQLVVKGLFYESAVEFCQGMAVEGDNAAKLRNNFNKLLNHTAKLSSADLSLVSWLEVLGNEQFTAPFQQKALDFRLDPLKKPKLEAQWTEQILATPIVPSAHFPHSLVPKSKYKFTQKMALNQQMSASLAYEPAFELKSNRKVMHSMSQSTMPSIGSFSLQQPNNNSSNVQLGEDIMKQSQIISVMLSESSINAPSASQSRRLSSLSEQTANSEECAPPKPTNPGYEPNSVAARQELEAICRRNQLHSAQRGDKPMMAATLPPVPELGTPSASAIPPFPSMGAEGENVMVQSRLFQEFQASRQQRPALASQPPPAAGQFYGTNHRQELPNQQHFFDPNTNVLLPPQHIPDHPNWYHHHYQQQPQQQFAQPAVVMRHHPQHPNEVVAASQLPPGYSTVPPLSSRPTSMVMPPQFGMPNSMVADHLPIRPRSYMDPSFPLPNHGSAGGASGTNVSQHASDSSRINVNRGESIEEELPEEVVDSETPDSSDERRPVRFVPVCRYEDQQAIRAVAFHPSGGHFAIGTNSRKLLLCRYPLPNESDRCSLENVPSPNILLSRSKYHRGSVYCAVFSGTGELLATGSNDKTVKLMAIQFEADKCRICNEMELQHVHDGTVRDLVFMEERLTGSSASSILVSGGAGNCSLCVADCTTGRTFRTFQEHSAPILGLFNWGSSTSFVSCSEDKTIRFWDLRASNATSIIWPSTNASNSPPTSVCVDPSGKLLVAGYKDASVMLYDMCGGRVVQLFRPHGDEVRTVRFSNAAYYLLSSSYDKRIVITDMRGNLNEPLAYLPVAEHRDKVIQCRWHPRDFVFLSSSADKAATLWSLPRNN